MEVSAERLIEVGKYLAQVREQHGLSQREVAAKAGMTASAYLSLIESGKRAISLKTLQKLAVVYPQVTLEEMRDHIGFSERGKLLPERRQETHIAAPQEPVSAPVSAISDKAALITLLDAAIHFMQLDPNYEESAFPAQTVREKVRDLEGYQRLTGRVMLFKEELRNLVRG